MPGTTGPRSTDAGNDGTPTPQGVGVPVHG